jgi:hypothetical protein
VEVCVRILPRCQEVLVRASCSDDIAHARARQSEPRERHLGRRRLDRFVLEDFLKFAGRIDPTLRLERRNSLRGPLLIGEQFKLRLLTAQRGGEVLHLLWSALDLDAASGRRNSCSENGGRPTRIYTRIWSRSP